MVQCEVVVFEVVDFGDFVEFFGVDFDVVVLLLMFFGLVVCMCDGVEYFVQKVGVVVCVDYQYGFVFVFDECGELCVEVLIFVIV